MSSSEDVEITVNIREGDTSGTEALKTVKREAEGTGITTRRLGWDMMILARSFNFLGSALGVNTNPAFHQFYTILMGVAVALRLLMVMKDFSAMFHILSTSTHLASIAMGVYGGTLANAAFWMNMLTLGAGALIAVGTFAAVQAMQPKVPSMQSGGDVPNTGLYLLHKGETVVPAGGPSYSWVNIDMRTGPLSSNIDVNNMLDEMSSRVISQSRRRSGY